MVIASDAMQPPFEVRCPYDLPGWSDRLRVIGAITTQWDKRERAALDRREEV
jgi:hypothetical protein